MSVIRRLILALALVVSVAPAFAQAPPPVPALPDTERRTTYSISSSICSCAVGFALYGDSTDVGNWLEVFINGVQVTQSGNWSIASPTGPLSTIARPITDAVLTFATTQTGTVQIVGARRPRRAAQFNENRGVAARDMNQVFTDVIAMLRENWDKTNDVTGRAVLAPPGESLKLLPALASRQNMGACFDSGGNLQPCVAASGSFIAGTGITFTGTSPTTISTSIPPSTSTGIRQGILAAAVNVSGDPAFATIGTGLNVNLVATSTPLTMSFAAGFSGTTGPVDFLSQLSSDVTSYWPNLPSNQYSFLSIDRNTGTGALTATQTLVRPQSGPVFYAPRQALLHFDGNFTDDWGNAWGANGASFTAPCAKFGSTGLRLSGSSSYVQTTAILNPGQGNWTMHVWANLDSNVSANIFSIGNGFGMLLATSASGKLLLYLSSGGVAWDTANGIAGSTTVTAGTFHHFAVVFTGNSYFAYLDGVLQIVIPSSVLVWPEGVAMAVGAQVSLPSTTAACFDEFEFLPYAKWPVAFTPPVAASTVSGDWFDTNKMVMNTATAAGPTWTAIQRQYVAEAVTGGATVTAVYDYSAVSQYRGSNFSLNGSAKVRNGSNVYLAGQSQFISFNTTIGSVVPWVLPPSLIPPDAKAFYVQFLFHSPIAPNAGGAGVAGQDCSLDVRIPVGPVGNYVEAIVNASNFKGMGTASAPDAHQEISSTPIKVPVINGIASLDTIISGTTCTSGGANAAQIIQGLVTGYEMP